ncbi:MAG: PHB depolymerase family esterase [Pseudomonadota bacterium]
MSRFSLALVLLCITATCGQAGEERSVLVGDAARTYLAHNLEKGAAAPRPLIVALHGYRREGDAVRSEHGLVEVYWRGLDTRATEEGWGVVYPYAVNGQWNLFRDKPLSAWDGASSPDDIAFLRALVARYVDAGVVDANRVYLTGFSDGAIMSYRALCAGLDMFAAAAPISGTMTQTDHDDCAPSAFVPLMSVFGTDDTTLPFDGWLFTHDREISVAEVFELWRREMACKRQKSFRLHQADKNARSRVRAVSWTGCRVDNALKLYRVEGGGHQTPSRTPFSKDYMKRFGERNADIETAQVVMNFFRRFRKE